MSATLTNLKLFLRGKLNEEKEGKMAATLMETRIRVKPNNECAVETVRLVDFNVESMICGYEYNRDACQVRSSLYGLSQVELISIHLGRLGQSILL